MIIAGKDFLLEPNLKVIEEKIDEFQMQLGTIESNMKTLNMKGVTMTPREREQITEHMFEADELEEELVKHRRMKKSIVADSKKRALFKIKITEKLYSKVKIIFDNASEIIKNQYNGPIEITKEDNSIIIENI